MRGEAVSVYGLFDLSGFCWYIGQTINPRIRRNQHANKWPDLLIFRVIRTAPPGRASRLECQIGRAYQRRGQASFNKLFRPFVRSKRPRSYSYWIKVEGFKKPFTSYNAAGRAVGRTGGTIRNNIGGQVLGRKGRFLKVAIASESEIAS